MKAPRISLAAHSAVMLDKRYEAAWLILFKPSESTVARLKQFNKENRNGRIKGPYCWIEVHQYHGWTKWPGVGKIVRATFDWKNNTCNVRIFNKKLHLNSMEC